MKKEELEFKEFVKSECKKHKIKCKIKNVKYLILSKNIKCGGYFDSDGGVLAVASNNVNYLGILAHEYSHMTQWLDKIELWDLSADSINFVDEWLAGKEVDDIEKHMGAARDLELDNEKRTVKIIKKHKLDINVESYIQKANAYIYFYTYMLQSRKWCKPNNSPYNNKILVDAMPKKFVKNYNKLPKKIEKIFIEQDI
jgi:hypothetical protein